jgi:hypothetical protein
VVRNSDIAELNVIVTFVTDIILLLMMLGGLLHLRRQGGGLLDLGNFLWKQVGCSTYTLSEYFQFADVPEGHHLDLTRCCCRGPASGQSDY